MTQEKGLTYADAGVDINAGNEAVDKIKAHVKKTFRPEVLTDLGGFGGLFALNVKEMEEPVLVSGTDGVGTKLKVAMLTNRHNTIGIDAVAMCVNDILVQGAEPLFFLDYLAVGKLKPDMVADIVKGIANGCVESGASLIGGETAEMPGFYDEDEYDVAGFVVGVVDKKKIIDGKTIKPGDKVIGIPSSGLHSNGYSLARKVLLEVANYDLDEYIEELGRTVGDEMLEPTRIYVKALFPLIKKFNIKGMAHITGGGLTENIPRVLPEGAKVQLNWNSWPVLPVFRHMQKLGNIADSEMRRTFNMGIGMAVIVDAEEAEAIISDLAQRGEKAYLIGQVTEGSLSVEYLE